MADSNDLMDQLAERANRAKERVPASANAHGTSAEMRRKADAEKAELDLHRAQHRADVREDDAAAAVDFALQAVEEAEYQALDAILARAEANQKAAATA